jgi:hypothetical protein
MSGQNRVARDDHPRLVLLWDMKRKVWKIHATKGGMLVIMDADTTLQVDETQLWGMAKALKDYLEGQLPF